VTRPSHRPDLVAIVVTRDGRRIAARLHDVQPEPTWRERIEALADAIRRLLGGSGGGLAR
jgi:hypothetical protein